MAVNYDELAKKFGGVSSPKPGAAESVLGDVRKSLETPTERHPLDSFLVRALEAPGKAIEAGAEKIIKPAASAIAKPFLRTAATGVSALRGAWNLATGNIEAEQVAQAKEDQRGGVKLGPLGTFRPVQQREGGGTATLPNQLKDMAGIGTQIATTIGAPGVGSFGAKIAAPKVATGLVTGGIAGLGHGVGTALEDSSAKEKGALETVGDVGMRGTTEGAAGALLGAGAGKLEDWWTAPSVPKSKAARPPAGPGPIEQAKAGIESMREELPSDSVKRSVLQKAQAADDLVSEPLDISSNAPGASAKGSKAFSPAKRGTATKAANDLIDGGMNPNRLDEIAEMSPDDLNALATAISNGRRVTLRPGQKNVIRLSEGLADNVEQNIDAAERLAAPYRKAISDAVREADPSLHNPATLDAKLAEALPSRTVKYSDADKKFVEKLIDRVGELRTLEDVHEFRQFLANETDAFAAPLRAGGVSETEGTKVADALRKKAGEYLDEMLADRKIEVNGEMMNYGEMRRRVRPLLDATDNFWKTVGGKWKSYDSEARSRRLGEMAGRLATNTSANTEAAFGQLKEALRAEGVDVGGDLATQAGYVKFVEDLFNAGPDRAIQQAVSGGVVQGSDIISAAQSPIKATVSAGLNKVLTMAGITGERAREKATEKIRNAFADYVNALLRAKKG